MTKLCLTESEKNSLILAVFTNVVEQPFDVFVIVEGFSIPCHRIILSAASSVFKKHFAGCGCNKISLLGVKYQDVHDILLLFYTGSIQADVSRLTELRKTHKKLGILIPFEELIKSMEVEEAATENHKSNDVSSNALVSCTSSPALDLQNCTPKPAENVEESAKVVSKLPTSAVTTESVSVQKAVSLPKMLKTRRASAKQSREKLLRNIPRKILALTKPPSIVEELKQKEMIMKHLETLIPVDQKKVPYLTKTQDLFELCAKLSTQNCSKET